MLENEHQSNVIENEDVNGCAVTEYDDAAIEKEYKEKRRQRLPKTSKSPATPMLFLR